MARPPEIGNVKLYPDRPLRDSDKNGFVLKFYCPIQGRRIRKNAGTRDRRKARKILRECSKRLTGGEYVASGGIITNEQEKIRSAVQSVLTGRAAVHAESESNRGWESCKEAYITYKKSRVRDSTYADIVSRLAIAERILTGKREDRGLEGFGTIKECCTLASLEYLQDRLYAGDECRYDQRSPMTVNTAMGAIMAFVRYCARHDWIDKVPSIERLDVDDPMKGRPITADEFEAMLMATPHVVGNSASESWKFTLKILWTTAFRVGDVMSLSWDNKREIHPLWRDDRREHPTIFIPSKQKNGKAQEIPMLPELEELLNTIPECGRSDWIANLQPIDTANEHEHRPTTAELKQLAATQSNVNIAEIYAVSETAVRKWLRGAGIDRKVPKTLSVQPDDSVLSGYQRLTKERVGRVIALIGKAANIVVQEADDDSRKRLKFASAHDIRRGCAQRLINQGVSAETLKLILRHSDFATTEKFYGAVKSAQAAANEIRKIASVIPDQGAKELSTSELSKLRQLLAGM